MASTPDPATNEWVPVWSLKGEGLTGPPGASGPPGAPGAPGPTGPLGGPAGPTGPSGPTGFIDLEYSGAYVPAPKVYNNGDVVVAADGIAYLCVKNNTTTPPEPWPGTGISAVGPTGPIGIQGPQGIPGPTGSVGAPGATGIAGPTGAQGPLGPTGVVGAHHATHEPGGADALVGAAWVAVANVFTQPQTFGAKLLQSSSNPYQVWEKTTLGPDLKKWHQIGSYGATGDFAFYPVDDAEANLAGPLYLFKRGGQLQIARLLVNSATYPQVQIQSATPLISWESSGAAANQKKFRAYHQGAFFEFDYINDAETAITSAPLRLYPDGTAMMPSALIIGADPSVGLVPRAANNPSLYLYDILQPANSRMFRLMNQNGNFIIYKQDDAESGFASVFTVSRTGSASIPTSLTCPTISTSNILFPPAQVASAGNNVLDDYEEGNWAPTMVSDAGGGGTSYGFQNGAYVKIGTFVYVFGEVQVTAANWASGNVQIGGLPFVVDSTRGWGANGSFGYYNNTNMTSFAYYFSMFPGNALSYIYFKNSGGSVGLDGLLQAGGVAAGCRFQLSFAYRTTP